MGSAHVAVADRHFIAVDDHRGPHAHVQPEAFDDHVVGLHGDVGQRPGEEVPGAGDVEARIGGPADLFGELRSFRSGNPFDSKPLFINSQKTKIFPALLYYFLAFYITLQVMTAPDMSPGNQNTTGTFEEGLK